MVFQFIVWNDDEVLEMVFSLHVSNQKKDWSNYTDTTNDLNVLSSEECIKFL